jgi:hypothetical protein
VSWASKKQNSVALSTAKAEYITAGRDENGRKQYLFGNQFLVVFL